MKRLGANIFWGILLIGMGVLLLLQNLNILSSGLRFIWAALFGAVGVAFLYTFFENRSRWWALIPGFTLLGLAVTTALTLTESNVLNNWAGPVFLGSIGLSFWAVVAVRRDYWWAIIPAGVLTTLAVVAVFDIREAGWDTGGIFLLGLALTFGFVYLLGRMKWALIPAAALAIIGAFLMIGFSSALNFVWPVVLIAIGLFIVFRAMRRSA